MSTTTIRVETPLQRFWSEFSESWIAVGALVDYMQQQLVSTRSAPANKREKEGPSANKLLFISVTLATPV